MVDLLHFELSEFDCPSLQGSGVNMDHTFLRMLDEARGLAGVPFHITSGYRTKEHNDSLKNSVPNSSHIIGHAADIATPNGLHRSKILRALYAVGFVRVGISFSGNFIHVDNDPNKQESCFGY